MKLTSATLSHKSYFHIKMADHTWLVKYSWWFACWAFMNKKWLRKSILFLFITDISEYGRIHAKQFPHESFLGSGNCQARKVCKDEKGKFLWTVIFQHRFAIWIKYDFWIRNQLSIDRLAPDFKAATKEERQSSLDKTLSTFLFYFPFSLQFSSFFPLKSYVFLLSVVK